MTTQQLENILSNSINHYYPQLKLNNISVKHKKFMNTDSLFITLYTNLNSNHNINLINIINNIDNNIIPIILQKGGEHYNIFKSNEYNIYRTFLTIKDINNNKLNLI